MKTNFDDEKYCKNMKRKVLNEENNYQLLQHFLQSGADIPVNAHFDLTAALVMAFRNKNFELAKFLVEIGADPNVKVTNGCTALMYASANENLEMVKFLVENSADPNEKNRGGWTALMFAFEKGNFEMVKFLVENGADPNSKNRSSGWKPLISASEKRF